MRSVLSITSTSYIKRTCVKSDLFLSLGEKVTAIEIIIYNLAFTLCDKTKR